MSKSQGETLRLTDEDAARYGGRVLITSACVIWDGSIGSDGYGRFWLGRPGGGQRVVAAHVVAAVLAFGEMAPGSTVLHDCDVRLCVRTDAAGHVRVSTQSENVRQAVARGRSRGRCRAWWTREDRPGPRVRSGQHYGPASTVIR